MKKGFTMIELIFVIVVLGILAAVAIPRLAASRDDAELASLQNDIAIVSNAVPAYYMGQKDARIGVAVSLDLAKWRKSTNAADEAYSYSLEGQECVTIAIWDLNTSIGATASVSDTAQLETDINATTGKWMSSASFSPVLRIIKGSNDPVTLYVPTNMCDRFWDEMKIPEANITMGGKKINLH